MTIPCGECYRRDHPEVDWSDPANIGNGTEGRCEDHRAWLAAVLDRFGRVVAQGRAVPPAEFR